MPTGALEAAESPALSLLSMSKSFGPTKALQNVDLLLRRGEVVALLGANGAGKSTLAKIASGVVEPNHGQISINGRPVRFSVFLNRASWPLRACFAVPRERQAISSPESRERQFRLRGLPAGDEGRVETYRQNRLLAMRAPSASAANFAQTMSGSTAAWPTHVP